MYRYIPLTINITRINLSTKQSHGFCTGLKKFIGHFEVKLKLKLTISDAI